MAACPSAAGVACLRRVYVGLEFPVRHSPPALRAQADFDVAAINGRFSAAAEQHVNTRVDAPAVCIQPVRPVLIREGVFDTVSDLASLAVVNHGCHDLIVQTSSS